MTMTITFKTMQETDDEEPDEGNPETFLEHSVNAGAEYLHIQPKAIEVSEKTVDGSQNQPFQHPPGPDGQEPDCNNAPDDKEANKDPELAIYKVIPTIEHSLKWKFALNPSWTNIYRRLGTVNNSVIKMFNYAKKETVLFTGVSGQRSYRYFNSRAGGSLSVTPWSLDFKFSQRSVYEGGNIYGWNHVYSPSKQKWVRPIRPRDNCKPLFEASDFLKLFRSGS